MGLFGIVDDATIKEGMCTDIYFLRTEEILKKEGRNPLVTMEVTATSLPRGWAIFSGLQDLLTLLEGLPLSVHAMPEGSIFYTNEPVVRIQGRYLDIGRYETSILGFLCHASGVATATAHVVLAAEGKPVYSFGSRRQHPAIAGMIERSAWIGGVAGVSNLAAPEGISVVGTMPHSFIICYTSVEEAFRAFDRHAPKDVPRIMLCDTHCDEKREALTAARVGAVAVRLDTPGSRRGDLRAILEEVRWELDVAGYEEVEIFLSGGLTREDVARYCDLVDAFGVGGSIANAQVVDFALDIVEIQGTNYAKRGKRSGEKQVYELLPLSHQVQLMGRPAPADGTPLLLSWMKGGRILQQPSLQEARDRVQEILKQLNRQGASNISG
jgi:nicotinate phosphoribosyltransferase